MLKITTLFVCLFVLIGIFFVLGYAKSSQPNILLITIDDLRMDHMSCYGYRRLTTPSIDDFAQSATVFTQAISHSSHTPISMGAYATGLYYARHRLRTWGGSLNSSVSTIAEILKKGGFETTFIADNIHFRKNVQGFDRGFDNFLCDEDITYRNLIPTAVDYLTKSKHKKFFLWLHYMGIHNISIPDESYIAAFIDDGLYKSDDRLTIVSPQERNDRYGYKCISQQIVDGEINNPHYYIAKYDAAIKYMDQQLRILFETLEGLNLSEKTVIVITSDHGELLGEHDYYFHHGVFLYEPLIRVPFILKNARISDGKRRSEQVEASVDILPTILDIVGIEVDIDFDGESLLAENGSDTENNGRYAIIDEGSSVGVRTETWKLIKGIDKEYQLFNLRIDSGETINVVEEEKEIFEVLSRELNEYLRLREIYDEEDDHRQSSIRPEDRKKLESLGYIL